MGGHAGSRAQLSQGILQAHRQNEEGAKPTIRKLYPEVSTHPSPTNAVIQENDIGLCFFALQGLPMTKISAYAPSCKV